MKFRVTGAEEQTAEDVDIVIEADSQTEAEQMARRMRILIEQITPVKSRRRADKSAAKPYLMLSAMSVSERSELTRCHTCGQKVAESAASCPHCGVKYPGKSNNYERNVTAGAMLVLAVCVFFCLGGPSLWSGSDERDSRSSRERSAGLSSSSRDEWYVGGTLHKSTMAEWNRSSYEDRLATCGDFMATIIKKEGKEIASMDQLLVEAVGLESCITETGRGGYADTQDVSAIAPACYLLMKE